MVIRNFINGYNSLQLPKLTKYQVLHNEAGIGESMKLFHPWSSPSALWFLNSTTTPKISSNIYMITLRSLTCISDSFCIPVTHKSKTRLKLLTFYKNNYSTNICISETTRKKIVLQSKMYSYTKLVYYGKECQMHNKHLSPAGRKHS